MNHAAIADRVARGWVGSDAADELADTLDLVDALLDLGAISPAFAERVVRGLAEEQAALWCETHAFPFVGVA